MTGWVVLVGAPRMSALRPLHAVLLLLLFAAPVSADVGDPQLGTEHPWYPGELACSTFEVFLTGGEYGPGKWVLLDHDLSTVIFDPAGKRLLSVREVAADWKRFTDRGFKPERQRGWLVSGLHPNDGSSYATFASAEYL